MAPGANRTWIGQVTKQFRNTKFERCPSEVCISIALYFEAKRFLITGIQFHIFDAAEVYVSDKVLFNRNSYYFSNLEI